ncbi:hypothetical protein ATN00_03485 [Sphingobium baderi]|uniref:Uncharacterized protein n=1 Tax=Sphingobium baderi TaxID=1332080 RepID=A0A0S3EVQ7_9SPHN|nr:hypothetical protein ATN00_03485 [Sphingobium baderi]
MQLYFGQRRLLTPGRALRDVQISGYRSAQKLGFPVWNDRNHAIRITRLIDLLSGRNFPSKDSNLRSKKSQGIDYGICRRKAQYDIEL